MKFGKRGFEKAAFIALIVIAFAVFTLSPAMVLAEEYPAKTIKLICPFGPGGATDLAARVLASVIPEYLGQPVVVVNKPGAGGAIAFKYVVDSKPDGYIMMMTAIGSNAMLPAVNPNLPFSYNDLTYVCMVQANPNVLVVRKDAPWKTFQDLVKDIKAHPGKYKYSVSGPGTILNFGIILMLKAVGLPKDALQMVPFDSGGEATAALLGGHVDLLSVNTPPIIGHLRAGTLRGLAVTTKERLKEFPNIPTYAELGYPQIDLVGWRGVAGPPGLPDYVVKKWEDAAAKMVKSKAWLRLVEKLGDVPFYMGTAETQKFVEKEFKRYRALAEELGILVK